MAAYGGNPEHYQAVITAVDKCIKEIAATCYDMASAATDCADTCEDDPLASKARDKYVEKQMRIYEDLATMKDLRDAIQRELDEMLEISRRNQSNVDNI